MSLRLSTPLCFDRTGLPAAVGSAAIAGSDHPAVIAQWVSSWRLGSCSSQNTAETWVSTVFTERCRRAAISLEVKPQAMWRSTSRPQGVNWSSSGSTPVGRAPRKTSRRSRHAGGENTAAPYRMPRMIAVVSPAGPMVLVT